MQTGPSRETMNIVITGHVDHGKSSLLGRLLADTGSIPEDRLQKISSTYCKETTDFEYAYIPDALHDERKQGITIDSARVFFRSKKRDYMIIDAPGHIEFLKNMVTGASRADAAFVVIDAAEGIQENSRRHGHLLSMLGISQICVLINKMDLTSYSRQTFRRLSRQYSRFLRSLNIRKSSFVPVSAAEGVNITERSGKTPWYNGKTVLELLDSFLKEKNTAELPFRMSVQDVYKFSEEEDEKRIIAGNVETGSLHVGEEILFLPSGKKARVKSIESFGKPKQHKVCAPLTTGITLEEKIYVSRGALATKPHEALPELASRIRVNIFWLGREDLVPNKEYTLKIGSSSTAVYVEEILKIMNSRNLGMKSSRDRIVRNDIAECILKLGKTLAVDIVGHNQKTSRFVLADEYEIAGGGIILQALEDSHSNTRESILLRNAKWERGNIAVADRRHRYGHRSALILLTGKEDCGKKDLAKQLEKHLFSFGMHTYYMGIGSILYGVDADIKKNPVLKRRHIKFREEHMRRLSEISHILLDAGMIFIVTAGEVSYDELQMIRLAVNPDTLLSFWCGDEVTTDIPYDYHIRSDETTDVSLERIYHILVKAKIFSRLDEEGEKTMRTYPGTGYKLRSLGSDSILEDTDLPLEDSASGIPAFLRTVYERRQISVKNNSFGIYKFADWLPIRRMLPGSSAPITYKSKRLSEALGLPNLYVTFNGYWPEKDSYMLSCTFKECEAYSVCGRLPEDFNKVLVVASAGNTARAFARVCSDNRIPLLLVVPQSNIDTLWFEKELKPWIKLITVGEHCDYFDAIYLSKLICAMDGFVAEGGAKNVARRDGMATTVLSAATTIGEIPDYYFQAVGSGTGAIAAWEANLRLNDDGRFGTKKMRLIVSQNDPFLLIYDSWKRGSRELVELDAETAKQQLERINAKVLSNRHPPYSLKGGLYDALVDTEGDVVSVTNNEAELAANLFLETEGIDIAPAASVALASLRSYARSGGLDTDSTIMLNITGGGIERFQKEHRLFHLRPSLTVEPDELQSHPVREKIYSLYKGEMIGSIR